MLVFINLYPQEEAGLLTEKTISIFKKLLQTLDSDWKPSGPKGVTSLLCNKHHPILLADNIQGPSNFISTTHQQILIQLDNKCLRCEG